MIAVRGMYAYLYAPLAACRNDFHYYYSFRAFKIRCQEIRITHNALDMYEGLQRADTYD